MDKRYQHSESYDCFVNKNGFGLDLAIVETGYEQCDPYHLWGPETRSSHTFHYIIKGKGALVMDNKRFELSAGDLFYIEPGKKSYYEADGVDPWAYKWVMFDGMRADIIIGSTVFSGKEPVVHGEYDPETERLFDNIFDSFRNNKYISSLLSVGHLYFFLAYLVETFPLPKTSVELTAKEKFFEMLRYVHVRYRHNLQVTDIADALGYDRTYVYKLFKKYISRSPSEYISDLRLKYALELMRENRYTLQKVALMAGFENYNWFFTLFKRSIRMSPQEYMSLPESERIDKFDERFRYMDDGVEGTPLGKI